MKLKKYPIVSNLIFVILYFQLSMFFFVLAYILIDNEIHLRIIMTTANVLELVMLFYLERFGRMLHNFKEDKKMEIRRISVIIVSIIIIILPINYWDTFSIYEVDGFNLQPYSSVLIISLNIIFIGMTIKHSREVISKILDDKLKTTYIWIHRGFVTLYFTVPAYLINLIFYLLPETTIETYSTLTVLIFLITILSATIFGTLSLIFMYIGLTLPRFILRKMFKAFNPMWEEGALSEIEEEKFRKEIEKLQDFLL